MHVVYLSSASDNEFDLTAAIARHNDISLTLYIISDPQDKNHAYHMSQLTRSPNIIINEISTEQVDEVLRYWSTQSKDLIIFRHPTWIGSEARAKEIAEIIKNDPYIITCWELVPNYAMGQMPPLLAWKRIACTNSQDHYRLRMSYPDKQILKLPFGVVDRTTEELAPMEQYSTDLICDAQPHYECGEYNGVKRLSVDRMIKPALELPYKLALWGSRYGDTTNCDWGATECFQRHHNGHFLTNEYPRVYSSAKIYLGVSWNYGTGGFSVRLARALSCGIMTIWHETEGRKEDLPDGIVAWSKSYEHTGMIINHYMKRDAQREKMTKRAKEWAIQNLEWGTQLKRLVGEIQ